MSRQRILRITAAILVVGFALALGIYFSAAPDNADALGYDPLANKKYLRELERIGGKANVLSSELQTWFADLWHGRTLAFTVAFLTAAAAWGFWFIATLPPADEAEVTPRDDGPP